MGWYSTLIVYESEAKGRPDTSPIREESIRVLRADTEPLAWRNAEALGRDNEHSYSNDRGELVTWRFVQVVEVQDLCEEELTDGAEVFSRMSRRQ
jgi:Domain of unknown function (DUF4288)